MKAFKITEQQLQTLAGILGEFPAKQVITAIDMLRALPETEELVEVQAD
jgi:hypothetical protein